MSQKCADAAVLHGVLVLHEKGHRERQLDGFIHGKGLWSKSLCGLEGP